MNTPAERLCSRSWRLRNSLWLAPAILLVGVATWASFLYIGIKAKRRAWLIFAGLYGVGMVAIFALSGVYSDGSKETSNGGESAAGLVIGLVWIGGAVHALITNREWLRWKANAAPGAAWYAEGAAGADVPAISQPGPSVDDLLLDRTATRSHLAPSARPPTPPPPLTSTAPASGPSAATPVDLNRAAPAELESGLGLSPATAERVVAERSRLGGFTDVEQLMTEAGVEPHVFASIRDRATLGPPDASGPSTRGRRLEL